MRVTEMLERPATAGEARLRFRKWLVAPRRLSWDAQVIQLPDDKDSEFFALLGNRQFLIHCSSNPWLGRLFPSTWFGGTDTDGVIFLNRVSRRAHQSFTSGGEQAFLESLKPPVIALIEQEFQVHSLRQGDLYAVPLPLDWEKLSALGVGRSNGPKYVRRRRLFGTRHCLTGKITFQRVHGVDLPIVEGEVRAPDHKPLILYHRPHLLERTREVYQTNLSD